MSGEEDGATHAELHKSNFKRSRWHGTTELTSNFPDLGLCFSDCTKVDHGRLVIWDDLRDGDWPAGTMSRLEWFYLI